MDLVGWLRSLGLERYEAAFRENEIDETVLPNLTAEDLKDLGVGIVGHRRKLLDAIAVLRADPDAKSPPAAPVSAPPPTVAPLSDAAGERRYLTVMFCDLVGSTAISSQLDAEEWRDLVGAYLDAASAAVTEVGGHVAKKLGDGLMCLFGYPVAHENDAERAGRAALAIQRALAELNRKNAGSGKPELTARIGLETGPAVVDAAGEIYGDVANIAARVQAMAEPGTVFATARVQRQIVGLFAVEERGTHNLKGVPEPTVLFRLMRVSGSSRRSTQRHLTPLVGRDEELALLLRRWDRARRGNGQLVLIVGEPGLGKSRLIEEIRGPLTDAPHTWLEWTCSQLLQNTPLHPIDEWGRHRFGSLESPAESRLAELESTLAQLKLDPAENIPLLALLFGIPFPQDHRSILAPEELRRRQLSALTNVLMASAKTQPVVLVVEDMHWADPTTLDLLHSLAERGALAPLFVFITARPEFRPPWHMRSHHTSISLAPLDPDQVRHMVGELAAHHALPTDVIESVTERTGGVPLFVEEVTRLLLDRSGRVAVQAVPPTLQQSLTARLDRLGPGREVAQIGSVIGRSFTYLMLRSVSGMEDAPLQIALDRLTDADIFLAQGIPPQSDYRFKHALIQDAAYEGLLKSRRQALHRRVAQTWHDNAAITTVDPELLAYHFTHAGMTEAAIEWWGKAGERSLERSALIEAGEQLKRAIDLIATLPTTAKLRHEHIKQQVAFANVLMTTKGYAAPETKVALEQAAALIEQAEALGEPPEDPLLLFSTLYGIWGVSRIAFNGDAMREQASRYLALATKHKATVPLMIGHRIVGISLLLTGSIAEGRAHLDQAIALYNPNEHHSLAARFAVDIGVSILCYRSIALWLLGYPDAALADMKRSLDNASATGQAASLMFALHHSSLIHIEIGNYTAALSDADGLDTLAKEKDALLWKASGTVFRGCVLALTGRALDAIQMLKTGIAETRSTGATMWLPLSLTYLARAYAHADQPDDARRCIDEAIAAVGTAKENWCEAEVNREAGEIAHKSRPPDAGKAEEYFVRARSIAQQRQAKLLELRAAMSLARLWRDQGKPQQARELLAPVYGWFTEGFDTRDLKEAKALLAELVSQARRPVPECR
jgi:class 3 adenylate cyclase/predicted ATPase